MVYMRLGTGLEGFGSHANIASACFERCPIGIETCSARSGLQEQETIFRNELLYLQILSSALAVRIEGCSASDGS